MEAVDFGGEQAQMGPILQADVVGILRGAFEATPSTQGLADTAGSFDVTMRAGPREARRKGRVANRPVIAKKCRFQTGGPHAESLGVDEHKRPLDTPAETDCDEG